MAKQKLKASDSSSTRLSPDISQISWPAFLSNPRLIGLIIFGVACLVYTQSLFFGFVMDDAIVITDNMFTQKGLGGINGILTKDTFFGFFKEEGKANVVSGGRYRPFTLLIFAVLHSIFGKNPLPFHLVTILLYALSAWMVFQCVALLLKNQAGESTPSKIAIAAIAALLFAVHPVHVEVVANIKGCDEIVSLLGSLGALYFTVRAFDAKSMQTAMLAGLIFLAGLFSKENAFMFVALIPAALLLFRRAQIGEAIKYSGSAILAGVLFFVVRIAILGFEFGKAPGDLMNNPFLKIQGNVWVPFTAGEKIGTILHTLTQYIRLMLFPHPLTHDYYPRHIEIGTLADPQALLALFLYGAMIWLIIKSWKTSSGLAFGLLCFLLTLFIVSNIVFPIGTNMGERFLFMPSFGFLTALSVWLVDYFGKRNQIKSLLFAVGLVASLFAVKTIMRVPAWQSNDILFSEDIKVSKRSAKLLNAMGGTMYDGSIKEKNETEKQRMLNQGITYLNEALKIHPTYQNAYLLRANCLFYLKRYDESIKDYKEALRIDSNFKDAKTNLAIAYRDGGKNAGEQEGNLPKALEYLEASYQLNQKDPETLRLLGVANGVKGDHPAAVSWFSKAVELEPQNARLLFDLGTAYSYLGNISKQMEYQQKALAINPNIIQEMGKNK